ncbi:hypothetical protein [Bythopirellula polymerisocia]|uniref:Dockerin domain-containing protein n=1 Tax=Bythopirellula polymerisocia TaxID=2528003 RepID=A0A5C6C9J6_9BACT|nr:hypothetical protein [Bythopirellula polymerisocia]TWU20785.1 hypothetical protein Pla144_48360 [Bythopirellula polymerisocia]
MATEITFDDRRPSVHKFCVCLIQARVLLVWFSSIVGLCTPLAAQNQRSAWMWSSPAHPYGAANVLGNPAKESELIANFGAWGFDRIYTSVGSVPSNDPATMARWNADLDDVGIDSQVLFGLISYSPVSVSNLVQTSLINFNNTRTDPREKFDGVHLDIEPHGSNAWKNGTATDKRNLLYLLRDTYASVRTLLDSSGYPEVKIYADLPVWYDSTTSIDWTRGERNQWFDDIATSLDGISMMAYERSTLASIQSGVAWEVANFNADVRVALNVAEIGPGNTFEDFDAMMSLAEEIESTYAAQISGIDFQPLIDYYDEAPAPVFSADFDEDGDVDGRDFLIWQQGVGIASGGSLSQGDANGSGSVNISDLVVWQQQYGQNLAAGVLVVPEPCCTLLPFALLVSEFVLRGRLLFRTARA